MTFPDDNAEFQLNWTHLSGKIAGTEEAITLLNDRAANLFINRKDDAAENLREMATHLIRRRDHYKSELEQYIAEGRRRNYEVQRKQPGHPGVVRAAAGKEKGV